MTTLAFVTEKCKSDAKLHGITDELDRLVARVEREQSTILFDHFPSDYIVKKKFGDYNNRVIGKHVSILVDDKCEIDVVVFLRVLIRGDHDYLRFSNAPDDFGEKHLIPLIDFEHLKAWCQDRLKSSPATPLPNIRDSEYGFLYGALHVKEGSSYISESHEWFSKVTQDLYREYMSKIGDYIGSIASNKAEGVTTKKLGQNLYITTRYFEQADTLALIDITRLEPTATGIESLQNNSTPEEIDRFCRRKYPDYILADLELWMNIEKDKAGNLALSPEESEVLNSVRQTNANPFPLFINGRAGSGKSTIIQYIYCDIMRYWLTNNKPTEHPPIYLTYSKSLLDSARQAIESIIKHDADNINTPLNENADLYHQDLDHSLQEFHNFLYSHLSQDDYRRFPKNARMTFGRFKEEWQTSQAKNPSSAQLGPDLCWHILRTFVKGFDSDIDSNLDPEDYANIHDGDKSNIPDSIYKTVYENIYERWYKPLCSHEETTRYWDDQDLVRYLISNERLKPLHPAIICDEAQDFTRIELEAILRLNLFSNRSLDRQTVSKIPLVFAGDQFQTLNPTGFRWESVKAWFVENFIHKLDPSSKRSDINYRELRYNYRSTGEIVRFSNLIQYRRGELFDSLSEILPQNPWSKKRETPVMRFSPNDSKLWEKLTSTMKNAVIIIPCDEEEVHNYIRNDKDLWDFVPREGDTPLMPIMCPSRAKGLEFQDVVLYRFGKKNNESNYDYKNRRLEAEYFINRLYVSVTRPENRLIILDNDQEMDFWAFARRLDDITSDICKKNQNFSKRWNDALTCLVEGNVELFQSNASFQEYEDTAKQLYDSGFANHDAYIMRQAAAQFGFASKEAKRRECLAWAAAFDGRQLESADEFERAGLWKDAASQLFAASTDESWMRLYRLSSSHSDIMAEPYLRLLDSYFNSSSQWEDGIKEFDNNLTNGTINTGDQNACSAWKRLITSFNKTECTSEQRALLLKALANAQSHRIPISDEILGNIAYSLGSWKLSIDYWDRIKLTKHSEYKEAKKHLGVEETNEANEADRSDRPRDQLSQESNRLARPPYKDFVSLAENGNINDAINLITIESLSNPEMRSGWKSALSTHECIEEFSLFSILHDIEQGKFCVDQWNHIESESEKSHIIAALSSSAHLIELSSSIQSKIATFLLDYWNKEKRSMLPQEIKNSLNSESIDQLFFLGCAIERSGNRNDAVNFYKEIKRSDSLAKYKGYLDNRLFRCEMRRAKVKRDSRTISDILRRFPGKTEKGIEEYPSKFSTHARKLELINAIINKLKTSIPDRPGNANASLDSGDKNQPQSNLEHTTNNSIEDSEQNKQATTIQPAEKFEPNRIEENFKFSIDKLKFEGWAKTQRIQISDEDGRMIRLQLDTKTILSDDFNVLSEEITAHIKEWDIKIVAINGKNIDIHFNKLGIRIAL